MAKPFYDPGRYVAKVIGQAFTEAKTGTTQFLLRVLILGRVDPSNPGNYLVGTQYERSIYRAITENTVEYFLEDLRAMGVYAMQSFKQLHPDVPNFIDLKGREIDVYCDHKPDQEGGLKEQWGVARQAQEFNVPSISTDKLRTLDNIFGKNLKSAFAGARVSAPAPVQPKPNSMEVADDDIPF